MANAYQCDVAIIGAGLAGVVAAIELLDKNLSVTLVDRNKKDRLGGLANEAFGGMALVDTPLQKLNGIKDSPELALQDWLTAAEFGPHDNWPKSWAQTYVNRSYEDIYCWLKQKGIHFFPAVQWVERGDYRPGNSVPRYHIVWGTGWGLMQTLIKHLLSHRNKSKLKLLFEHTVNEFEQSQGNISGCTGTTPTSDFSIKAESFVLACGGINGNLEKVKKVWDPCYGKAPNNLLNGSHPSADGKLHEKVESLGGSVTHLEWMWNYAAGISHPEPEFKDHGLSLIPPRSALWMDCYGNRIGPKPLVTSFDTHDLCKQVGHLDNQYSWQIMNWKIAVKEMAISGSHMNPHVRDKKLFPFLKEVLLGNKRLVNWMVDKCPDVICAQSLNELTDKMNNLTGQSLVDANNLKRDIEGYDQQIARGVAYHNDDQLRRISQLRNGRADKLRTCNFEPILNPKAMPLIAIRERIISRKSMGGMQTDLHSRILDESEQPIKGLYAVGEAAGFGGGGISGIRSLEGTFLSSCILTSRIAARSISGVTNP